MFHGPKLGHAMVPATFPEKVAKLVVQPTNICPNNSESISSE